MDENLQKEDITIYGTNNFQQKKIYDILKVLEIPSKCMQNINFLDIKIKIQYFSNKGSSCLDK